MEIRRFYATKRFKVFAITIEILVIIRLLLPYIVLHYANKNLAAMSGYYGHISDIDLSLYRGAYQIKEIFLNKVDDKSQQQTEFFKAQKVDLAIQWKPLFKRRIVGQLVFEKPTLIFTKNKIELEDVQRDSSDFRKILKDFMPLQVNLFEIRQGSIHYVDPYVSPKVDISLEDTYVLAQNLTNAEEKDNDLPATVSARAKAYEGSMVLNMKLDPLAYDATFDLNAEIKNSNLVLLNDFFKAYGRFDVSQGNLGLYTEFAANEGKFKGYVKPIIKDLEILGREDKKDSFFQKLWEGIADGVGDVLENPKKEQVATKLAMEGSFEKPRIRTLDAVFELLRNAFIRALVPSVDHQITLKSLQEVTKEDNRTILQRILNKPPKEKKKK
ncbi:DUF748 domain-containing protein [Runella zeae]|uniref:DUF748 domain-containing protein n=1 Tax=Runella zeae TaxID=94255 RepID=UPI0003FAB65B|nr:DUF748 domain-containing protein [Runella zeae]